MTIHTPSDGYPPDTDLILDQQNGEFVLLPCSAIGLKALTDLIVAQGVVDPTGIERGLELSPDAARLLLWMARDVGLRVFALCDECRELPRA